MNNADEKHLTRAISDLLQDKRYPLAELCKKAISNKKIDQKLKKHLDPSLSDHFELANIKTDVATILVNSPAWATRLRYNIPAILSTLNKQLNFSSVNTVRIKVKKVVHENITLSKKPTPLSKSSVQVLVDVANNFSDPELRSCLLKLSKHHPK
jgi:hypothetical protein